MGWSKIFAKSKTRIPLLVEKEQHKLEPNIRTKGVIWMSLSANIMPISNGPSWQDGHGKICKVWKLKTFNKCLHTLSLLEKVEKEG
jgi:hypothetical protein